MTAFFRNRKIMGDDGKFMERIRERTDDFILYQGCRYRILMSPEETPAVKIAANHLKTDLESVFDHRIQEQNFEGDLKLPEIVIGTMGVTGSPIPEKVTEYIRRKDGMVPKEAYVLYVEQGKLYLAGSDRRGTVYGIYTFCEQLGVSPWYFWADVPPKKKECFRLKDGYKITDAPSIEYRGIFINDEEELESWVQKHMGETTIGVKTYEKIFELLLRLKANYIWPAMHVNSFNQCPENGALAERMGIVVGTSHCDMLMRSNNREWKPWIEKKGYTDVHYDYSIPGRNREILKEYWTESVEQNRDFEVCYTLGMRGIHDSGFETCELEGKTEEEKRQAKIKLLEMIIRDQMEILDKTLSHDTMKTFIPYKEVLELYDAGLRVPEELTMVWANDNYGYIRRYPSEKERHRVGGNGIYYHNSYWAPPGVSYVFLGSTPLAHTRYELSKAYEEGIRKLWVINTGAMKPLELEIEFFLRLAWEIGKEQALTENVDAFVADWMDRNFDGGIGGECARLLNDWYQVTNVRKPEMMDYDVFSQTAYGDEAVVRIHKYEELFQRGNRIYEQLPMEQRDAFFQLVLMRIHAGYFTNLQFYYGDRSTLMFERGEMSAAEIYAKKAREMDDIRRKMILYYNKKMAGGKWDGILDPEGFPPPRAAMMPLYTPPLAIGRKSMKIYLWNDEESLHFVSLREKWFEIANKGEGTISYCVEVPDELEVSSLEGTVTGETRILVRPKREMFSKKTRFRKQGEIRVRNMDDGNVCAIKVTVELSGKEQVEDGGMLFLEADMAQSEDFEVIRRLGRGFGALVGAKKDASGEKPLVYHFELLKSHENCLLEIHRFPSLNSSGRIRIGVSVDGGDIRIVESFSNDEHKNNWKENVRNNVDRLYLSVGKMKEGWHTLQMFAIDSYFAFSRLILYTEKRKENNLAGIAGNQLLPLEFDSKTWADKFYGAIALRPRPVEYASLTSGQDSLLVTGMMQYPEFYGRKVKPAWYTESGRHSFGEKGGNIRIDAAAVLSRSSCAYAISDLWKHCGSESCGGTGLAMYVRERGQFFSYSLEAPSLNYRICCQGGTYVIWILCKFNQPEEGVFGIGLDGDLIPKEELYNKGSLWRYEAEQIYRWIPAAVREIEQGEHLLRIFALASGMRYDRIYLTRGEELPPLDPEWIRDDGEQEGEK
ncbi:MAG: glycosyl hydrolase 115 family protein [Fusicatenibacter sp.]